MMNRFLACVVFLLICLAGPAWAADTPAAPGFSGAAYEQAGRAVFFLFVLAVVLESALALLFNWKPFTDKLSPRAVRPLIAFFISLLFVYLLDIDVIGILASALNGSKLEVSHQGKIITAMVIAGGSSGVNTMLVALGFRSVKTPETSVPKPPPEKAWLAVRAPKGQAVGDLLVFVGPPGNLALLGVIKGRSKAGSVASWFLSDPGRLPTYGGLVVPTDKTVTIEVIGKDEKGMPLPPAVYGPLQFAKGALVDIDITL